MISYYTGNYVSMKSYHVVLNERICDILLRYRPVYKHSIKWTETNFKIGDWKLI